MEEQTLAELLYDSAFSEKNEEGALRGAEDLGLLLRAAEPGTGRFRMRGKGGDLH